MSAGRQAERDDQALRRERDARAGPYKYTSNNSDNNDAATDNNE